MSDYTVSIPEELYDKARRIAEQTAQPVDDVILAHLEQSFAPALDLPDDERAELRALAYLSDDALWTMAREQMAAPKQAQMQVLMDRNSRGTITDEEYATLSQLVEYGQRLTLRKAEAMKHLLHRGYEITLDNLKPADE
ncbi:MAG: hypothetical protein U0694_13235 [Anaerolineae bacterium]